MNIVLVAHMDEVLAEAIQGEVEGADVADRAGFAAEAEPSVHH
jgi:hypothetical protein